MEDAENMMDYLILNGAMEVSGINEDGTFLYTFTEKLKDLAPDIHEQVAEAFFAELMTFWELGFVQANMQDAEPIITLTAKCFSPEARETLTELQNKNLDIIIQAFREGS